MRVRLHLRLHRLRVCSSLCLRLRLRSHQQGCSHRQSPWVRGCPASSSHQRRSVAFIQLGAQGGVGVGQGAALLLHHCQQALRRRQLRLHLAEGGRQAGHLPRVGAGQRRRLCPRSLRCSGGSRGFPRRSLARRLCCIERGCEAVEVPVRQLGARAGRPRLRLRPGQRVLQGGDAGARSSSQVRDLAARLRQLRLHADLGPGRPLER